MTERNEIFADYFSKRNVSVEEYRNYRLPRYIKRVLPSAKTSKVLDIGCGFGQVLSAFQDLQYVNVAGVDISNEAVSSCMARGLAVTKIDNIESFCRSCREKNERYDFIIMSHVLEHIEKKDIIDTMRAVRTCLMNPGASILIMVPNAQSNTGCYWAYEDFTHTTLFTAGSLSFVLASAGFKSIDFLDQDGTSGARLVIRVIKKILLPLYRLNKTFWNRITSSSYHKPSPQIFTYEIKAIASK